MSTRQAQRRRTRSAIVEATRRLLADADVPPTVDDIAAAAEVSRRTVYVHFPSLDQLLLDAALGSLSEAYVDTALAPEATVSDSGDAVERVEALLHALGDLAPRTLPLGRQIIRHTIDSPGTTRGVRRVGWIESALEPLDLSPEQHERLVSALSLVVGFEADVVLRDVRGLDDAAATDVQAWAARALVEAMLAEAGGDVIRTGRPGDRDV